MLTRRSLFGLFAAAPIAAKVAPPAPLPPILECPSWFRQSEMVSQCILRAFRLIGVIAPGQDLPACDWEVGRERAWRIFQDFRPWHMTQFEYRLAADLSMEYRSVPSYSPLRFDPPRPWDVKIETGPSPTSCRRDIEVVDPDGRRRRVTVGRG